MHKLHKVKKDNLSAIRVVWLCRYMRLLLLRANRLGHGMESLPFDHDVPPNAAGSPLVPLQELVKQL